ncbi:MAG: hypothetical protein ACREQK_05295 [Candidatus Binatia bacterium]
MSPYLPGLMLVMVVLSAFGCLLAVPVAVHYYQSTREYVATAEVAEDAQTVYRTAVKEAQARASTIRIVRRDDSGRLLEITDGVPTASIKAVSLSGERTEIVVVADGSKGGKEKEQELALRIIRILADSLGVRYEITKK